MSELAKRVAVAVPAAALMLWLTWKGGVYFQILFGLITIGTVIESHGILKKAKQPGFLILSLLLAAAVWAFPWLSIVQISGILLIVITIALISLLLRNKSLSRSVLSSFFSGLYAPLGFLMIVEMRQLGGQTEGFWLVLAFFLMIWGNDIFAYFGGKNFGKHPLAPTVSPKKTWEGFFFGFPGAATGFVIAFLTAGPFPLSVWSLLPLVITISVAGPVGDLVESRLKRTAGVKDSSGLLPGHGGLFDRFDSMIMSAPPVFFIYWLMI